MDRLIVPVSVREATERYFRECGRGARECLVVWTGDVDGRVQRAIHIPHLATVVSTEVNPAALYEFNRGLVSRGERALAQLHTHPGAAFHSATDDAFPLVHSRGFVSIVVPDFGRHGLRTLHGCFIGRFQGSGYWKAATEDLIEWRA